MEKRERRQLASVPCLWHSMKVHLLWLLPMDFYLSFVCNIAICACKQTVAKSTLSPKRKRLPEPAVLPLFQSLTMLHICIMFTWLLRPAVKEQFCDFEEMFRNKNKLNFQYWHHSYNRYYAVHSCSWSLRSGSIIMGRRVTFTTHALITTDIINKQTPRWPLGRT